MFKWIVNLFKKKETPVEQRLRLTEQQLREIGEQAVREVAAKKIVTNMIEENRLEAVISMPSGVFKPYAGVSTGILIFTSSWASEKQSASGRQ